MSETGKHCQSCGKALSFWAVFRAPWPTRIFCNHCKFKQGYRYGHAIGFLALLLFVFLGYISLVLARVFTSASTEMKLGIWVVALLGSYELLLLLGTTGLRRYGRLVSRRKPDAGTLPPA